MKKLFLAIALLLGCSLAHAQGQGNVVMTFSGSAYSGACPSIGLGNDIVHGNLYFCAGPGYTWTELSSGGSSGTVSGQANGVIPLGTTATSITQQSHLDDGNTTAGTITSSEPFVASSFTTPAGGSFGTNDTGTPKITGSANTLTVGPSGTTLAPISGATINANQVNGATIPASASLLGTNSSRQLISVSALGGYTNALNYTPFAAQWTFDMVVTNGSATITSATANFCNGSTVACSGTFPSGSPRTTDVGAIIFCNSGTLTATTLWLAQSTITAVNSSSSITVSTNGTASASGTNNGLCIWGPDESSGISSAWTATACGGLFLPTGGALVQSAQLNTTPTSCFNATIYRAPSVFGTGPSSSFLIPTPNFSFTGCTGGFTGKSCFGSEFATWGYEAIWGGGYGAGGTQNVIALENSARAVYVNVLGWGSNITSMVGIGLYGNQASLISGGSLDVGKTACQAETAEVAFYFNYCLGTVTALSIPSGTSAVSINNAYNNSTASSATVSIIGTISQLFDTVTPAGGSNEQLNGANAIAYIRDSNLGVGAASGATGLFLGLSGSKAYVQNTKITGGSSTGEALDFVSGTTFVDQGGNTIVAGGSANTIVYGQLQGLDALSGGCTGTATASQTLYLFGLGGPSASTCTVTTLLGGQVMQKAGTLTGLWMTAGTGGTNSSSGLVTVLKNGSSTTLTCTFGTATSCNDNTHTASYAVGDVIAVSFTTQSGETLANVKGQVWAN